MSKPSDYRVSQVGDWHLVALPVQWNADLERRVLERVHAEPWAEHPSTIALKDGGGVSGLHVKIFHRPQGISALKDLAHQSKARRFWRQSLLLSKYGFDVPRVIAAGEQRRRRFLQRGFVVTESIAGHAIPGYLKAREGSRSNRETLALKRDGLKQLAGLIRRFHQCGFVHGDLVATNILVFASPKDGLKLYFMDNDRTRLYPSWLPQLLWKRNLVQLNRMPLPGISLQDRMRFLHTYLDKRQFSAGDRKLMHWLEAKTRRRRKECDGVDPSMDFRRLMRWLPEPERQ